MNGEKTMDERKKTGLDGSTVQDTHREAELDEHLAVTDREFDAIREFVIGDSGVNARLMMARLAVGPGMTKSGSEAGEGQPLIGSCVHVLLNERIGVGKTHRVKVLAAISGGTFGRIQCNPDLRPTKILGGIRLLGDRWVLDKGPIFVNFLLVDEVNRADEEAQSAFLEVMGEGRVSYTVPGERDEVRQKNTLDLPQPFMAFLTQNPIEQSGVKPLPEAQLDRLGIAPKIKTYTTRELNEITKRNKEFVKKQIEPVASIENLQRRRAFIYEHVFVSDEIRTYISFLVKATHSPSVDYGIDERKQDIALDKKFKPNWEHIWNETRFDKKYELVNLIACGSSPRGVIFLENLSQAAAFLAHKREQRTSLCVLPKDVEKIAVDVLAHRIWLTETGKAIAAESRYGGEHEFKRKLMEHIIAHVQW